MTALEIARKEADRLIKEDAENKKQEQLRNKAEAATRSLMYTQINEALDWFDGINNIRRNGYRLYKNDQQIAVISIEFETWDNPNTESNEVESGLVIRWTVKDPRMRVGGYTGTGIEDIAKAMARHLV